MSAGGAAAAAAAAIIQATRASGVIVTVEPRGFMELLRHQERPLVVHAVGGIFSTNYQYLVSHKGLAFYTKSPHELNLPANCDVVRCKKIWIPAG